MRNLLATLMLSVCASFASAAPPAPPVFGCPASMAEYHQFDFWIGRWEVRDPSGKSVIGHSRIESVADGCGISEQWTGAKGSNGVSYNAWDPQTGHWHQFWIGNNPDGVLTLTGGVDRGSMVMVGARAQLRRTVPFASSNWMPRMPTRELQGSAR